MKLTPINPAKMTAEANPLLDMQDLPLMLARLNGRDQVLRPNFTLEEFQASLTTGSTTELDFLAYGPDGQITPKLGELKVYAVLSSDKDEKAVKTAKAKKSSGLTITEDELFD